jgi:hypothetical protein
LRNRSSAARSGRSAFGISRVAVGQTDGAEQNGIGFFAQRKRRVRQRLARGVNAGPADGRFGDLEIETEFFLRNAQNLDGFTHDFRADAVAGERRDFESSHLER